MSTESSVLPADQPRSAPPADGVRLELKPESGGATGFVDGGWWPRGRDLAAELPALLAAAAPRIGTVERVSYRISDWEPAPRRMIVDGALVRLDGFAGRPVPTVDVIAATRRLTLLVVAPDTAPGPADRALTTAGRLGNTDRIADLLAPPAG
jgi:hypothetical protein